VTLRQPVAGDLFAAAGNVDTDASVGGDALLTGGKVRVSAGVAHSVFTAGGQVMINGQVGRNVRAAGGQVEFGPASRIAGNVSVAGGQVSLRGAVLGHVHAAGGRVFIDGPVSGNVLAASGQVELGPNARIAGTLRYRSGGALRQDPAAQVQGGIQQMLPRWSSDDDSRPHHGRRGWHGWYAGAGWLWTAGLVLIAALLLAALPGGFTRVSQTLQARPGMSVLLGFVLIVCLPIAALLFLVTLIGIPLGLLTIALYLALLPLGYISAAIGLGDWALRRLRAEAAERLGWRIGAAGLSLVALALLGAIPWLGGWMTFAALLAGLGAMLLQWRGRAPT
jgi:cytoskeletal protein CcmA (bactofilin family)